MAKQLTSTITVILQLLDVILGQAKTEHLSQKRMANHSEDLKAVRTADPCLVWQKPVKATGKSR